MFKIKAVNGLVLTDDSQDFSPRDVVRRRDKHNSIEPARAAKCRIHLPRSVRGSENQDAIIRRLHPVQFCQELIHELTPASLPQIRAAGTKSIDFIEE